MYVFSIFLIVLANTVYNLCTKWTPARINPFVALFFTYLTAAALVALAAPFYPSEKSIVQSLHGMNWTTLVLGFAIVGLEFGYLMAYRAGWNLSLGSLVANILLAIVLIPLGIWLCKEHFGLTKVAGTILCIAGLALINKH